MLDFILNHETELRLGFFMFILILMMILEALFPRKKRVRKRDHRWLSNLSLIIIDSVFVKLIFPIVAVGTASISTHKGWGLFNITEYPAWLELTLTIILLDMAIYWQHVFTHRIPILWSLHKVHHVDRDIDVTTGSRFHPIEIGLSMVFKMCLVFLLGASVVAVIIFEIILNGCAMFNHSNVKLPLKVDMTLRRFIVTPDMQSPGYIHERRETSPKSSNCSDNYFYSRSL